MKLEWKRPRECDVSVQIANVAAGAIVDGAPVCLQISCREYQREAAGVT